VKRIILGDEYKSFPVSPAATEQPSNPSRSTGRRLKGALSFKIGTAIVSGEFQPGQILPSEVEFATTFGVSRGAVRETVRTLAAKGLVESRPKAGTMVLQRSRWNLLDPEVLAWAFVGEPDLWFVRDLFELRGIIEPAAARLAALRHNRADLLAMKQALVVMRRFSTGEEEGQIADYQFHAAILAATQNNAMMSLTATVGAAVRLTTQFKQRAKALPRDPVADHVAVYDAIAAADSEAAAELMSALVKSAFEDTRTALERKE